MIHEREEVNLSQVNLITTIMPSLQKSWIHKIFLVLIGTLLLTLSAKVQVPFYPVPMTMQTFVILVIAMTFGTGQSVIGPCRDASFLPCVTYSC